ncbi:MAG: GWxTD domain-containing protein, partial [Bacteroidota bacterium]|nr:GWxTD domain-containing protein [Bacteroidota bacterium]
AVSAIAQQQQGTVEMDAVAFVRDPGKIQVEIYYSILEGALRFEQKGTVWSAPINARAEIWQDGHAVAGRDIKKEVPFTGTTKMALDSAKTSLMLDGTALTGNFRSNDEAVLIFHVKDEMGRDVSDTIKRSFFAPTVLADKFYLGGVELARTLTPAVNHDSPFEKVGYVILPNPSKVFGQTNSKLNYYTELYIPASSVSASARCEVVTRVLDAQKHEMFSNSHSQTLAASTIPLIGSIDIDGLPTDSYILEIVVKRGATTEATMQKVFFFDSGMKLSEDQGDAASAAALDEETVYASSDISKMAQLEVEEKGDQAMYIGSGEQTKDWKKLKKKAELDGAQKESAITDERRFLYHFWRTKDKEQGSSVPLVAYKVYYAHVDEANKKFTYQKTAGWKSDFGRIYLTYGAPEERYITKQLHNTDAKPYITWEYYDKNMHLIAGSHAIFAFVDVQGGGKFVLVHSNVEGESYEPNWYSEEARRTN